MATTICYNLLYNESTSAFEKHGLDTITSASFVLGSIVGTSGTCTLGHHLYFDIDGLNVINDLNLSADFAVTSANDDMLPLAITTAEQETSAIPNISAITYGENMKISLTIKAISPIIKTIYDPLPVILPTSVVKR